MKNILKTMIVLLILTDNSFAGETLYPYLNTNLSVEERIRDLVGRMSIEEKIAQMGSALGEATPPITRLGIGEYAWCNECLHGVAQCWLNSGRGEGFIPPAVATVFPQSIGLASTWNPDLMYEVATVISDEARALYNAGEVGLTFWSPNINIARDPRWGRTQEAYGEDPYLASRMAVAFVKGIQGDDPGYLKAVACPKHFALNNEEWCRHSGSSNVSERVLREYYLPHFKACITEAHAQAVMCAYNAVNGIPCCSNRYLLTDILRNEWGFDGFVVSDCDAVYDIWYNHRFVPTPEEAAARAVNAGCDHNCGDVYPKYLMEALRKGLVSQGDIDTAVFRLFRAKFRLGMFDPPEMVPYSRITKEIVNCAGHRELARKAACESIVLLKNGDDLLPLAKDLRRIAVIGPNADVCEIGNYSGTPPHPVTPLKGIKDKVSSGTRIDYAKGCDVAVSFPVIPKKYLVPAGGGNGKKGGLVAEYFDTTDFSGQAKLIRTDTKINFYWKGFSPAKGISAKNFSVRWKGFFTPPVSRTYQFSLTTDDTARFFLEGTLLIDARFDAGSIIAQQTAHLASVELIAGHKYDICIEYSKKQDVSGIVRLGWNFIPSAERIIRKAASVAKKADVAVVFVGSNLNIAEEERDRSILDLPGMQEDLIREVSSVNPKTVVVLVNGEPVSVNRAKENVPAILEAWYPGEQGGNAIADVLFGDYNPAGRLPVTFYKSADQLPPFNDYDILKGRTYMYFEGETLFPFGHGLSYTQFKYGNMRVEKVKGDGAGIYVKVDVENTGTKEGDEVVQLYVHDAAASVKRPIKELKGFRRVNLKPQEKKEVAFTLEKNDLSFYDVGKKKFVVEPGMFDIMTGSSSRDIRLKYSIEID